MKYLKLKFLLMFFALAMAIPPAWAGEVTTGFNLAGLSQPPISVTVTQSTATTTITGDSNETWNIVINNLPYSGMTGTVGNKYWQLGKKDYPINSATFSTSEINGTIKKIVVNCASYNALGSINATVDGNAFGAQNQSIPLWSNNKGGNVTFEGNASGEITITMASTSSGRATYIQSITVTYEEGGDTPTNPWIKVTPDPLNIDDDGGVFTVSCANMPDNGLGVSVDSSSPSNAFSFTKTNDNTFNEGDKYFPLTNHALENGTVQVNYTGHALSAAGVIKFESTPESTTADVKYLYDGDIYIVGDVEGSGWSTEGGVVHGVPLVKNADGTYSATVTATAGGEGSSWLYFTKSIDAPNYDALGDNRFGPVSNDLNWPFTDNLDGVYCDLDTYGNLHTIKMSPGQYTITINPATNQFKIEEIVPINACPAVIEFSDNTNDQGDPADSTTAFSGLDKFLESVSAGQGYIQGVTINKVYPGKHGIKFGTSSVGGNLTINLKPFTNSGSWKTTKVIVNAMNWQKDNGTYESTSIIVNNTSFDLTNELADYEFTFDGSEISSLMISSTARMYVKSITIMHECGDEPILEQVATPTFNPAEGEKDGVVDVRIECATGDATIYYTLDGSEPTSSSNVYGDPIHLNETTTVKAIAMKDGMDNSAVATAEYTLPTKVETIAAAQALNENTKFIFDAEAVVTFQNGSHLYIRQGEASGQIFGSNVGTFTNGDVLNKEWSAKYEIYQQYTPEFTSPKNVSLNKNNGAVAPLLLEKKIELSDVNKYAAISGVTITRIDGINYYFTDGESKAEYCLRRAYADLVPDALLEGKTYNVEGVVVIFFNETDETYTPQLNLTKATLVKQDPGLAFSEETVNTTYGAAFTAPTLSKPEDLTATISYASDNTNVATVDAEGKVTIVGVGTAKITASSTETTYYFADEASYNIVVSAGTPTFAYSADAKEVVFGAENPELPTLNNPNELQVTYSSSKPEVATVDETGKVTIVGIGETIIKATGAATGNYSGAEAQYTLTVTAATPTFAYSAGGYSSNFYEMPSKAAHAMAGLDRKVPNKPEDYKACDALKSCI